MSASWILSFGLTFRQDLEMNNENIMFSPKMFISTVPDQVLTRQ